MIYDNLLIFQKKSAKQKHNASRTGEPRSGESSGGHVFCGRNGCGATCYALPCLRDTSMDINTEHTTAAISIEPNGKNGKTDALVFLSIKTCHIVLVSGIASHNTKPTINVPKKSANDESARGNFPTPLLDIYKLWKIVAISHGSETAAKLIRANSEPVM